METLVLSVYNPDFVEIIAQLTFQININNNIWKF